MSRINDLYDRTEYFGHTAGSSTLKDDGSTASLTPPSFGSEVLDDRHDRTLTSRQYGEVEQHTDLYDRTSGYGHSGAGGPDDDGGITLSNGYRIIEIDGSAVELDASSGNANRDVDATYADYAGPNSTMRAKVGLADRTSGWGHGPSASVANDIEDA